MNARQTLKYVITISTVLLVALTTVGSVFAVHDVGLFELDTRAGVDGDQAKKNDPIPAVVGDGNTIDEAAPGDDWENVYLGNSSAFATSFIEDTFANNNIDNGAEPFVFARTPEVTFFTGGGSKDTNGIHDGPWKYKIVKDQVPDKNDIVNAFAAAYDNPNDGHTIFYFGLDTFSVNGDANAGFWFFRHPVGLNPPVGDTGTFSGEHTDGDIFVAVAYTQGGSVGAIDVYEWQGDDATGSLVKIESGQDCAIVGPNDDVCGVINKLLPDQTFGEDPVFDYANTLVANNPLDPTSYQYQSAAFVEFGLDVNAVLGESIGCFTSFLAEIRSSSTGTFFAINEIGLGSNGFVTLTNFTDVPASLAGLYLCQGSSYFELPDTVVPAGGTFRVSVSDGSGYENIVVTHATIGKLQPSDGEIALLASKELDNPKAMFVYFQWGSTPHQLTQTAIDAGLWVKGGYGPSSASATRLFKIPETGPWLFEEQ